MKLLRLTQESPAANLAIDESLLETAELRPTYPEVLRIWEPTAPLVVLGRSSPIEQEVNLEFCQRHQIPVLRRCSGGQTIVTGPGCLMYAVLLDYRQRPELRMLDRAHQFVMNEMQRAIESLQIGVQMQGTSDLTYLQRKFSGNSLRSKRDWFVYHGTLLCEFDLELISQCLNDPIRQPAYRAGRSHREFLIQLPTTPAQLTDAIVRQWSAEQELTDWPTELSQQLETEKYATREWTYKV